MHYIQTNVNNSKVQTVSSGRDNVSFGYNGMASVYIVSIIVRGSFYFSKLFLVSVLDVSFKRIDRHCQYNYPLSISIFMKIFGLVTF